MIEFHLHQQGGSFGLGDLLNTLGSEAAALTWTPDRDLELGGLPPDHPLVEDVYWAASGDQSIEPGMLTELAAANPRIISGTLTSRRPGHSDPYLTITATGAVNRPGFVRGC